MPVDFRDRDDFRLLVDLLFGGEVPDEIPPSVFRLASEAMVLEVVAARPEVRKKSAVARNAYLAQAAIGSLRLAELTEIAVAMGNHGIEIVPQKGMAYGLMFESGGPVRAMADIDLLVKERDYAKTGAIMERLGYQEMFAKPIAHAGGHHERQFVRDGRLVEIHRAFLRGRRISVDYDALWERTRPVEKDGIRCRMMCPEDTLLYHCFHWGMHEFALGGLRSAWEMRRLIVEDGAHLETCARRAREWGVLRIFWCAARIMEEVEPRPAAGYGRPLADMLAPAPGVRFALERFVVGPSVELLVRPGLLPRPVQLFRKALLVDRLLVALSYLWWYGKALLEVRRDGRTW